MKHKKKKRGKKKKKKRKELQRESNETVPVVQNQLTESRRRGEGREGKQLFQSFGEGDPLTIASFGRAVRV